MRQYIFCFLFNIIHHKTSLAFSKRVRNPLRDILHLLHVLISPTHSQTLYESCKALLMSIVLEYFHDH